VSDVGCCPHHLSAVLIAAWVVVARVEARGKASRAMWMGIGILTLLAAPAAALLPSGMAGRMHHGTLATLTARDGPTRVQGLAGMDVHREARAA
jgi:hypothetical protein